MSNLNDLVSVVMQIEPVEVDLESTVAELAMLMDKEDVGTIVVTASDDTVQGIVTDRDIVTKVIAKGKNSEAITVSKIMTVNPETISQFATCREAITKMGNYGFRRLPVVDEDYRLVGVISISDLSSVVRANNEYVEDILCIINNDARFSRA